MNWQKKDEKKKQFYKNLLQGNQIKEVIKAMLEKSGYLVLPYGYEITLSGLIHKLGERGTQKSQTVKRIKSSPDLLVYDDLKKDLMLVEVKMRNAPTEKSVMIKKSAVMNYKKFWSDSFLAFVIPRGNIFYVQRIEKLDDKGEYDATVEFQKFEDVFTRVGKEDLSYFKKKALQTMKVYACMPQTDEESKAYSLEEIRRHHPRAYEKWTPEEDELLAREYGEGVSLSELAMKHQRKIGAIRSRLNKLGLISE